MIAPLLETYLGDSIDSSLTIAYLAIQYLSLPTQMDELILSISLEMWMRVFQFDQVFLIPAALESMRLINSSLLSLTPRSKLMSAFVWVRKQTIGKANLAIIIGALNQIEKAGEGGGERQRKWRKRTMGILVIIYTNSK